MGLDIGLEQTGRFEHVACVEKVPAFCETIRRNRDAGRFGNPSLKVFQADIRDLTAARVMADLQIERGQLDLIVGGPPCQAFSVFGRRRGLSDERGKLVLEFIRFIDACRPHCFIMENVRGLLSLAVTGSNRKGSLFETIQQGFNDIGYRTDCFLVNSANYGAPQIRERIVVIGNRHNQFAEFPKPTHSDRVEEALAPFRTLGDAIRDKVDLDPTIMDFSPRKKKYLAMVPPGGNWRSLPDEIQRESMGKTYHLKGGRSAYWRKLSFEFPCPTVMTMPNHAGTSMCHPDELRPLTVGECAMVQEFPETWEFAGTPAERYQQVGNAVPIILGQLAGLTALPLMDLTRDRAPQQAQGMLPNRIIHLRPHVRTRCWWKDGEVLDAVPYSQRPRRKRRVPEGPTLFDIS